MNASRTRSNRHLRDEVTASISPIPSSDIEPGSPHFFPLQAVLEIKGFLGKIEANIEHLTTSVDGLKVKVDDLVRWKTLILGGFIVVCLLLSGTTWLMNQFTIDISPRASESASLPDARSDIASPKDSA